MVSIISKNGGADADCTQDSDLTPVLNPYYCTGSRDEKKLQVFVNKCLRRIMAIFWPIRIRTNSYYYLQRGLMKPARLKTQRTLQENVAQID
ncbi:hypothetical protein CVS40_4806 [Lucilia cuprina]|nr:hypothetical protein CVS40_4806 [Lucilia cuprina]